MQPLYLSLTPDPISAPLHVSILTDITSLVGFEASVAPRMQQCPSLFMAVNFPHLFFLVREQRDEMVSWIVEQCGQLHLLYISLVIYCFTLHLSEHHGCKRPG